MLSGLSSSLGVLSWGWVSGELSVGFRQGWCSGVFVPQLGGLVGSRWFGSAWGRWGVPWVLADVAPGFEWVEADVGVSFDQRAWVAWCVRMPLLTPRVVGLLEGLGLGVDGVWVEVPCPLTGSERPVVVPVMLVPSRFRLGRATRCDATGLVWAAMRARRDPRWLVAVQVVAAAAWFNPGWFRELWREAPRAVEWLLAGGKWQARNRRRVVRCEGAGALHPWTRWGVPVLLSEQLHPTGDGMMPS